MRFAWLGLGAVLATSTAGCTIGGPRESAPRPMYGGAGPRSASAQPSRFDPGSFRPHRARRQEVAQLKLPGSTRARPVRYDVVDGLAVTQGDILLGPADQVVNRFGGGSRATPGGGFDGAMPLRDRSRLWPGGVIPYEIDASVPASRRSEIDWARGEMAAVGIQVRPRTAADADYVVFRDLGDGCNSQLGRSGGAQPINLSNCGERITLHELMHAVGFQHEHARSDRDTYVTIQWDDIVDEMRSAFEKGADFAEDFGPYDYASVVHYPTWAFSKTGNPTILPRTPGIELSQTRGLSDLDKAGIRHMYGPGGDAPPQQPQQPQPNTPQTNPWGLPIPLPPGLFPGVQPTQPAPNQPVPNPSQPNQGQPQSPPQSPPQGWPQGWPAPPALPWPGR